jgi:hypothetical protein
MSEGGKVPTTVDWARFAVITGLLATASYFFSVVIHLLPVPASRLLFFAIGPLSVMSSAAFYMTLRSHHAPLSLAIGALLNIIAGVLVNVMAVVQATQFTILMPKVREADGEVARDIASSVLWGVNVVQSGLDVCWDIFASLGAIFLAVALMSHPRYGRVFGWIGILAAGSALGLNLYSFPTAPAEAGLIDFGPAVGLWYVAVLLQLLRSFRWLRELPQYASTQGVMTTE